MPLDQLDLDLLNLLLEEPQAGMREYARVLGVARGTVQARLARLEREGVIAGHAPAVSLAGLGYGVLAFVHLYLAQGQLDSVATRIGKLPEVLEAHTTTGEADLLCRVAARSNLHLEEIVHTLLAVPGVTRTKTEISLNQRVSYRILPLVQQLRTAQTRERAKELPGALVHDPPHLAHAAFDRFRVFHHDRRADPDPVLDRGSQLGACRVGIGRGRVRTALHVDGHRVHVSLL